MRRYFHRLWCAILGRDSEVADLQAFNEKFKLLDFNTPGLLTRRLQEERHRYLLEEVTEFKDAMTLEDQADALVDIVYIAKGTARMLGLPWEALWDDVQRANMAKVSKATARSQNDVTKPIGWEPPNGWPILYHAGYGRTPGTTWADGPEYLLRDTIEALKTRAKYSAGTVSASMKGH